MNDRDQSRGTSLLSILRRRGDLILAVIVVAAGAALVFSLLQDKKYSSSASMALQPSNSDPLSSPLETSEPSPDQRQVIANGVVAARGVVVRRTAEQLEKEGQAADADAVSSIEVSLAGESDLIKVEAAAPKPETAARAAN